MSSSPKSRRREQVESNFKIAAESLQKALSEKTHTRLREITFPDFGEVAAAEQNAMRLEEALDSLIQVREKKKDQKTLSDMLVGWFRASYPFAQLFLTVVKDGANVRDLCIWADYSKISILNPYGLLCGGLIALLNVTQFY